MSDVPIFCCFITTRCANNIIIHRVIFTYGVDTIEYMVHSMCKILMDYGTAVHMMRPTYPTIKKRSDSRFRGVSRLIPLFLFLTRQKWIVYFFILVYQGLAKYFHSAVSIRDSQQKREKRDICLRNSSQFVQKLCSPSPHDDHPWCCDLYSDTT